MGCAEAKKHEICLIIFATIILTYVVMALSLTTIFVTELNYVSWYLSMLAHTHTLPTIHCIKYLVTDLDEGTVYRIYYKNRCQENLWKSTCCLNTYNLRFDVVLRQSCMHFKWLQNKKLAPFRANKNFVQF